MAQRVYLVHASADTLGLIEQFVLDPKGKKDVCVHLAKMAHVHQCAVAVSERVVAAIKESDVDVSEHDDFLRSAYALPYFVSAESTDALLDAIDWLEQPHTEKELEEFYVSQGEKIGLRAEKLDHNTYALPEMPALIVGVSRFLDVAHSMYAEAVIVSKKSQPSFWDRVRQTLRLGTVPDGIGCSIVFWQAIGMLLGRLGPAWWQGRNRWLGSLAYRERFQFSQIATTTIGSELSTSTEMKPSEQVALPPLPTEVEELRKVLRCTTALSPIIAGWENDFSAAGAPQGTCAFVAPDDAKKLSSIFAGYSWKQLTPYVTACFGTEVINDWAQIVHAAARYAEKRNLYTFEGDEIFELAYRWPSL